jgi:hypothetical protein
VIYRRVGLDSCVAPAVVAKLEMAQRIADEILIELGRNAAQSLTSIDESDARCSCGWVGSIDDIDGHTCALDSAMEGRDEPDPRVVLEGPPEACR